MAELKPNKTVEKEKLEQIRKSGPSGATTTQAGRESKFEEEGGDEPQAASELESADAPNLTQGLHGQPNPGSAPSQSTASDWDMNKTKPSGSEHTDRGQVPVAGKHNQQSPQLKDSK